MHSLVSILYREPDPILESDPIRDVLKLWKDHGVQNAIVLDRVGMRQMIDIGTKSIIQQLQADELSILFDVPKSFDRIEGEGDIHRMVLAIVSATAAEVETLLDETEKIMQRKDRNQRDLIFVLPLAHVRRITGCREE